MSCLRILRPPPSLRIPTHQCRCYAAQSNAPPKPGGARKPAIVSSCPANTPMEGFNYLKNQPPVLALPDNEYPEWLWTILEPRVIEDDGPGGIAEKKRLRKENKQRIKDKNFLKTQ